MKLKQIGFLTDDGIVCSLTEPFIFKTSQRIARFEKMPFWAVTNFTGINDGTDESPLWFHTEIWQLLGHNMSMPLTGIRADTLEKALFHFRGAKQSILDNHS